MFFSALASFCLAAPLSWATFPPDNPNQWKRLDAGAKAPKGASKCLPNQQGTKLFLTEAPNTYFVVAQSLPEKVKASTVEAAQISETVSLLRADGTCIKAFTCDVPGDGLNSVVTDVHINAQHIYLFMCTGQADNYRFYQLRVHAGRPEVHVGQAAQDLDVVDPYTGESRSHG